MFAIIKGTRVVQFVPLASLQNVLINVQVMGKVKKGRHRQQTENEEGEVLREERVRNKTWKVEVPANEILGPGDYVVKTTCLALVLVHDDAFAVLNKYEALVKGEDEE